MALYQRLKAYPFPGNVRELEAMVFDAVAQHRSGLLSLRSFNATLQPQYPISPDRPQSAVALEDWSAFFPERLPTLKEAEQALVAEALRRADGNQGIAAGMLGLTRQALNKRLTRRKTLHDRPV
jgi:DNA-binding NtrC family response regulator